VSRLSPPQAQREAAALSQKDEYWRDQKLRDEKRIWSSTIDLPTYAGYQSPRLLAVAVFENRFNEDLLDLLEE
jgi:hypothetical protein